MLMTYSFPGNVRELRNILERAMVVSAGPFIEAADLNIPVNQAPANDSLEAVEHQHIAKVLEQAGGNVSQAARTLGIDRVTLYNKIRKYHLREPAEKHHTAVES
jgi:DNA-binding NtrC family response regulator